MKDLSTIPHFEPLEKLVNILMQKTQNQNPLFFRILTAYYFTKIASTMRINIKTHDRGIIPINMYAINVAASGSGKTYSTNIIEDQIINQFKHVFLTYTLPSVSEKNLYKIANYRANKTNTDPDEMIEKVKKEYESLGQFMFSFDSGTSPAVKQMRHMLLMANAGSVNLEMDEFVSNLMGNTDVLNTFLELFDIGKVKAKLIKNNADNKRSEEIDGRTPTNMMLFGAPAQLLCTGSRIAEEFHNILEIGYARRCFFGYSEYINNNLNITPEELYLRNTDPSMDQYINCLSNHLGKLADEINFDLTLTMTKDVALAITDYQLICGRLALAIPDHQVARKAELQHRYYKSMKLAGAFAFIDGSIDITEKHVLQAIKLAEESGEAFIKLTKKEQPHKVLAKYIAERKTELTMVDLMDNLPFFKGSEAVRRDLITRAVAYGYKNNIVIKRTYMDDIEFFTGESMEVTDLSKLIISHSTDITTGYVIEQAPFEKLHVLINNPGYHYTAHQFNNGYRHHSNLVEGFNLVILDVDSGVTLNTAQMLLKDYTAIFATTKSHTVDHNRFRVIMPLSHVVKVDPPTYSRFMENVFEWLPFSVDVQTKDCARKWESFKGEYYVQSGKLMDAIRFIPNTNAQEKQSKRIQENSNLSSLERWFHLNTKMGNRSNQLIRYAYALIDNGQDIDNIRATLQTFNTKLKYPLSIDEINNTVMKSVANQLNTRQLKN